MAGTEPRVRELRASDPRTFGAYEIVGRLGEGGMGSVFLANSPDGRPVALKVIRAELADNVEFRTRFRQEVARAAEVPPFCTAEVLDADTEHDPPYLVVEYVDGPSLADVVVQRGPLTPANQHGIALGVAIALTAIHGAGVIHRDLKPSNVLLAPGSPKVIDFGIARTASGHQFHTRTDEVVGTVAYMAPERFGPGASQALTPAADVFAWGTIVAFAATGRTPFSGGLPAEVAARIMTQPPDLAGLSGALRNLVERALAKDPADRPTARELVDNLLAGGDRLAARPAAFAEQPEVLAAAGIAATGVGQLTTVVGGTAATPAAGDAPTQIVSGPGRPPVVPGPRPSGPPPVAPGPRPGGPPPVRIQPPPPRVGAPSPPPPRSGSGIGVAVIALTVAVLVLAGAVFAIWNGRGEDPVSASTVPSSTPPATAPASLTPTTPPPATEAPTPTPTPTALPSTTPSASAGPNVLPSVAPGAVSLIAGSFGNWTSRTDATNQAACEATSTSLRVTLDRAATGSYRCRGPNDVLTDFTVKVDVTLANANSCAGVWFHYSDSPAFAGYVLMVCADRYELITHVGSKFTSVVSLFTGLKTDPGRVIRVGIQTKGNRVWFYRNDGVSAEITANQFAQGRVVLGVLPAASGAATPYDVTFTNVHVWYVPAP